MSAEEPAEKPSTKQPSVLELCMAQQSHHQSGIRLSFNPEIADAITLEKWPYHYCAVTGNVNLAAFLYVQKVPFNHGIMIANFAADGKDGNTPWKKPITLSPLDVADMAGHRHAALILAMIGTEVPLHWSREKHAAFPKRFRNQAKIMMDVLVSNPFFVGLPGSARVQLVNTLMTSLAQEAVWSGLSPEVWQGRWEDCVGDDYDQAQQLSAGQQKDAATNTDMPALASYQFAIRPRQPSNQWRSRLLLGLAVGLTAVSAIHESGLEGPFADGLTFCIGFMRPVSTLFCVGVNALFRRTRSR